MMTLRFHADSISCFFCCVFSLNFLVTTLVSQPFLRPDLVKTLLVFKNEFSICNDSVTSSWTEDTTLFDGVEFDGETGAVTELHLGGACLSGSLKANSSLFRFQHLRYLNLSFNDFSFSVPAELGRLINLDFLDLHHNGFTGEVPSSILNLTRLTSLDLSFNKLSGAFPPIHNLTELSDINLSYNNFSGTIPSYLFTMPLLLFLDVHHNRFSGPLDIPNSESPHMFESLNLGNNLFSGQILEPIISSLVNLMRLDIAFLNITFPSNFTFMPIQSLQYLDISGNNVSRLNISSDHAFPTTLIELHLSSCNIHEFPKVLKTLVNLQHLDISNNRVEGEVPGWLWNLLSLTTLILSHNSIHGFQGSPDGLRSSSLLELDVSSNAFHGSFPIIPRSIEFMSASNNHFTGDIPDKLCDSKFLNVLDLSNNSFSGPIPECFGESLQVLNLSNNNLRGEVPDIFYESGSLTTLDVGYNHLTGKLPRSLANCTGLEILNVESNRISDTFPFWLKGLPNLQVIVLRANRFYGHISSQPLSFPQLRIIDISNNRFHGSLPPNYFANWSAPLISMPKGDDFPKYMVHLGYKLPNYFLRPEGTRKNTYMLDIGWPSYFSMHLRNKGLNRELEKISVTYTAIDFSGNRLGGLIPESIGLLNSLIVLDLSNNKFTGHIPSSLSKLRKLESLDLSRNQLSGKIPQELSVLTFLGYIDMSYNKLSGHIPQSTQIVGQPKSSFEGNIGLCGLPLQETCFKEDETPSPELPKQEEIFNWEAVAIGYGPGVLVGLAIGEVIVSFKPMWFVKLFRL